MAPSLVEQARERLALRGEPSLQAAEADTELPGDVAGRRSELTVESGLHSRTPWSAAQLSEPALGHGPHGREDLWIRVGGTQGQHPPVHDEGVFVPTKLHRTFERALVLSGVSRTGVAEADAR